MINFVDYSPGTLISTQEPTELIRDWDYLLDEEDCES